LNKKESENKIDNEELIEEKVTNMNKEEVLDDEWNENVNNEKEIKEINTEEEWNENENENKQEKAKIEEKIILINKLKIEKSNTDISSEKSSTFDFANDIKNVEEFEDSDEIVTPRFTPRENKTPSFINKILSPLSRFNSAQVINPNDKLNSESKSISFKTIKSFKKIKIYEGIMEMYLEKKYKKVYLRYTMDNFLRFYDNELYKKAFLKLPSKDIILTEYVSEGIQRMEFKTLTFHEMLDIFDINLQLNDLKFPDKLDCLIGVKYLKSKNSEYNTITLKLPQNDKTTFFHALEKYVKIEMKKTKDTEDFDKFSIYFIESENNEIIGLFNICRNNSLSDDLIYSLFTLLPTVFNKNLIDFCKECVKIEIEKNTIFESVFRVNSIMSKSISQYFKIFGIEYVTQNFKDIINEICELNLNFEGSNLDENVSIFKKVLQKLFNIIFDTAILVPIQFVVILDELRKLSDQKFKNDGLIPVGGIFFLRFLCIFIFNFKAQY
jgi:hypothetical protein